MRYLRIVTAVVAVVGCAVAFAPAGMSASSKSDSSDYVQEPLPPGIRVVMSELEGPVFADATGHTLYHWQHKAIRNNTSGESEGEINCYDTPTRYAVGFTSPYPGGSELPNPDNRPTCTQHWPPVLAAADAKPVGNWTLLTRKDGKKQWAYKQQALYTSHLDTQVGETNGGTDGRKGRDLQSNGAPREPVGPAPAIPPQFNVAPMNQGQMLVTLKGWSVYAYDRDAANKSNCVGSCLEEWQPIMAPDSAVMVGDWSVVNRGGVKQWAFRGKPLYTRTVDPKERSYEGGDVPGWHNVFVQRRPAPPKGFHLVDTVAGQVLAEPHGKTIYFYQCNEDTADTLFCDSPDSPQVYRWAVCGGGDVDRCNKTFPYVIAEKDAKSDSISWSTRDIDPKSGHYVAAGTQGSLHVWAFRGRPIYTFAGDKEEGDIGADSWGQDHGDRNGFNAFWMRDDYKGNDGPHG